MMRLTCMVWVSSTSIDAVRRSAVSGARTAPGGAINFAITTRPIWSCTAGSKLNAKPFCGGRKTVSVCLTISKVLALRNVT